MSSLLLTYYLYSCESLFTIRLPVVSYEQGGNIQGIPSTDMCWCTVNSKFVVDLISHSSVHLLCCSGQIFEWWYFRKYGTSFIEQVSVSHLRPLLGGVENSSSSGGLFSPVNGDAELRPSVSGRLLYSFGIPEQDMSSPVNSPTSAVG